jgi:hypothetical protein
MGTPGREHAPPRGLRPAQLGVVLVGRVTLAHLAATVVDLAARGRVAIEPVEDDGPDWQIAAVDLSAAGLLGYEQTLLQGLFDGPQDIRLGQVTARMIPLLDRVRSQVVRDAVGAGLLGLGPMRRLLARGQLGNPVAGPVKRTRAGDELLKEIKAFRRELRAAAGAGGAGALAGYAPYAMIFGLAVPLPIVGGVRRQPADDADPRATATDFATRWHKAWESAAPPETWRSWSTPGPAPGHSAAPGHAHGYHDGGFHGGHGGGFGGGHGGGFGGGHG